MAAPTMQQISDMDAMRGSGSQSSNGAYLSGALFSALNTACGGNGEYSIGLGDAIDIYTGFVIENDMAGGTLVADSSSSNPILAFVGRVREIYAEQNPT